jgi:two-component system, NarL family, sensor kinase
LFMVIRESLNNVLLHSEATYVTIQIVRHKKELTLLIEDNGKGFDAGKRNPVKGNGFKNIESRIAFLNGEVQVDSHPGKGTTIAIEIPLLT